MDRARKVPPCADLRRHARAGEASGNQSDGETRPAPGGYLLDSSNSYLLLWRELAAPGDVLDQVRYTTGAITAIRRLRRDRKEPRTAASASERVSGPTNMLFRLALPTPDCPLGLGGWSAYSLAGARCRARLLTVVARRSFSLRSMRLCKCSSCPAHIYQTRH